MHAHPGQESHPLVVCTFLTNVFKRNIPLLITKVHETEIGMHDLPSNRRLYVNYSLPRGLGDHWVGQF